MMEQGFLRAIVAEPDDDAHRLIYADWLDEHGQSERAEFIRVQIELTQLPERNARRRRLQEREKELLENFAEKWSEPVREFACADFDRHPCTFRRGFVERMVFDSDMFIPHAAKIFARTPLREAWFPNEEQFGGLARCRWLGRLSVLDLTMSGLTSSYGIRVLLRSRHLANLTTFRLCGYDDNAHLDVAAIEILAQAKQLKNLRDLDVGDNWFDDEGVFALCKATCLTSLKRLGFHGVGMTDIGIQAIASTPALAQLEFLDISANHIGDPGLTTLLDSPYLKNLIALDVSDTQGEYDDVVPATRTTLKALKQRFKNGLRV